MMSYAVKEIFYTLQGEGAQTGRAAVFCRFAGCNLWSGRESDRAAAVCRFCDTEFVGVDVPGGGKFDSAEDLAVAIERTWPENSGQNGSRLGKRMAEHQREGILGRRAVRQRRPKDGRKLEPPVRFLIGDPALLALEEQANRFERTGEELVYHDLAHEWRSLTGLPFVSAVWCAATPHISAGAGAPGLDFETRDETIAQDFIQSRIHGLQNIDALVAEWSKRLPISEQTLHTYLTTNIHYVLDEECLEGMRGFFRIAASLGILPEYDPPLSELAV